MTNPHGFDITVIGDRINPGFKSTKALLDNEDLAGIQALAVQAGRSRRELSRRHHRPARGERPGLHGRGRSAPSRRR